MGVNHGRKIYKNTTNRIAGQAPNGGVDVFMYYWDNRDGPSFEGWWFGNQVGGTQVWSHSKDQGMSPPVSGWQIPWDGGVCPTLVVMSKDLHSQAQKDKQMKEVNDLVNSVLTAAKATLDHARAAAGDCSSCADIDTAVGVLEPLLESLSNMSKQVIQQQAGVTGETAQRMHSLSMQLQASRQSAMSELERYKKARVLVQARLKEEQEDEAENRVLDTILAEAEEKANQAEDLVEKSVITAEMVRSCEDDVQMVAQACDETEKVVKEASAAMNDARLFINAKTTMSNRFRINVKARAGIELGKLSQQLQDAQNKLNPLRSLRKDVDFKRKALQLAAEVDEKVAVAEVYVDKAEELHKGFGDAMPSKEVVANLQQAISTAELNLQASSRLADVRKENPGASPPQVIESLEARVEVAKQRLHHLRLTLKQSQERATAGEVIREAVQMLQQVTQITDTVVAAQGDDSLQSIAESEASAQQAQHKASSAKLFIQTRSIEFKRFSSGPSGEALAKLNDISKQLSEAVARLAAGKAIIAKRKRKVVVADAEKQVKRVEELIDGLKKAANSLVKDENLLALTPEQLVEATSKTAAAQSAAQEAMADVRKFITRGQVEAKGSTDESSKEISADLLKLQTRLATSLQDLTSQDKTFMTVEQRLAEKRLVARISKRVAAVQEQVTAAQSEVAKFGELVDAADADLDSAAESLEPVVEEAQLGLRNAERWLASQSRVFEFVEDPLSEGQSQLKAVKEQLEQAVSSLKEHKEMINVRATLDEVRAKLSESEAAFKRAKDTAIPFEDGKAADLGPSKSTALLTQLEKLTQAAITSSGMANMAISMKRLECKRLPERIKRATGQGLDSMQSTVEASLKELAELKTKTADWRKASLIGKAINNSASKYPPPARPSRLG
eukprot:gnl/TRDRNA2_/TRDRNA2_173407_c3_seq2.p1 gnl/TRDRNA2_/TRDRNA2_173407_c3~~gnl/TRDRNA2_/TRDRNA2_173407_c3_seq2.p1  ORF type:complete len:961 (+),score=245.48 gnl/TRDRNA2_/TRDRNA2_173407_c3_seq2:176-2884(+)